MALRALHGGGWSNHPCARMWTSYEGFVNS
jgi:hypothetical protein